MLAVDHQVDDGAGAGDSSSDDNDNDNVRVAIDNGVGQMPNGGGPERVATAAHGQRLNAVRDDFVVTRLLAAPRSVAITDAARQLMLALVVSAVVFIGVVVMAFYETNSTTRVILMYCSVALLVLMYRLGRMLQTHLRRHSTPNNLLMRRRRQMAMLQHMLRHSGLPNIDALRLAAHDGDFDANDYEHLLRLDDDTPTTRLQGATQAQVNRLPTFTYKSPTSTAGTTSKGPNCMICLDDFHDGDVIRIIPCFHQFHQPCIDRWLLQKAVCPVCKAPARGGEHPQFGAQV